MLYIRHAQKAYRNGGANEFSLDPGLTEEGKQRSRIKFHKLVVKYGVPSKIVTSPYLRARETAQIAHDVIFEETGHDIKIIHDPIIGEYLGHQFNRDIFQCLRPDTLNHNPIPPEEWEQYSARIYNHVKIAEENTWFISHGIVIQSIAYFNGKKIPYPSELGGICIQNTGIIAI